MLFEHNTVEYTYMTYIRRGYRVRARKYFAFATIFANPIYLCHFLKHRARFLAIFYFWPKTPFFCKSFNFLFLKSPSSLVKHVMIHQLLSFLLKRMQTGKCLQSHPLISINLNFKQKIHTSTSRFLRQYFILTELGPILSY